MLLHNIFSHYAKNYASKICVNCSKEQALGSFHTTKKFSVKITVNCYGTEIHTFKKFCSVLLLNLTSFFHVRVHETNEATACDDDSEFDDSVLDDGIDDELEVDSDANDDDDDDDNVEGDDGGGNGNDDGVYNEEVLRNGPRIATWNNDDDDVDDGGGDEV